jgi:hypothetical protein
MRYIHLTTDSYILYTSTGVHQLTNKSLNFHKIKRLILQNKDIAEEEILPYLEKVELKEGLYEAYLTASKKLVYAHYADKNSSEAMIYNLSGEEVPSSFTVTFLGVYASLKELMEDWPEYLI